MMDLKYRLIPAAKPSEEDNFRDWLKANLPVGQRRTYLGRETVVIGHYWTNDYDAGGVGLVTEYRDDNGVIREAEYRFAEEAIGFLEASREGVRASVRGVNNVSSQTDNG